MLLRRLPTELHAIIFELLCTAELDSDTPGYYSACRLCLVSRYIYKIVIPIMYRTILIDGRTKASLLSRTFQHRSELSRSVQHLFISDHARQPRSPADDDTLEVPPSFAFDFPFGRAERIEQRQRMGAWLTERAQILTAFRCAMYHILSVVSTRLQVLSICLYGHYDENSESGLTDALAHPFPLLVHLTIRDTVQSFPRSNLGLPMLERLRLVGGNRPFPVSSLGTLVGGCPRLTHIWLSEIIVDDSTVSALESLVLSDVHPASGSRGKTRKLNKTLQHVVLKPSLLGASLSSRMIHERLVALSLRSSNPKVAYFPTIHGKGNSKREIRYPLDEALRNWVDCVMGRFDT